MNRKQHRQIKFAKRNPKDYAIEKRHDRKKMSEENKYLFGVQKDNTYIDQDGRRWENREAYHNNLKRLTKNYTS